MKKLFTLCFLMALVCVKGWGQTTVLSQGFENAGALPTGWVSLSASGNSWGVNTTYPRTGSYSARYAYSSSAAANAYLISSGVALTANTTYTISYYERVYSSTYPEKLGLKVGTAQTIAGQTTEIKAATTYTNTTYAQVTATFTPTTSGTYYFSWVCTSAANEWNLYLDDITITAPILCTAPTIGTPASITSSSASIPFTCTSCSPGNAYIVEYGVSGFTPGTGATAGTGGTIVTGTSSPIAISGLSTSTTYDVYVRQNCSGSGNGYSANSSKATFTTLCTATSIPYTQGFNSTTIPTCWSQTAVSGSKPVQFVASGGTSPALTSPYEGTAMVYFPSYTTSGAQTRLVSAPLSTTGSTSVDVQFQWYHSATGGATNYTTEGVTIQYSTDGTTWTNSTFISRYNATTGWSLKTITLPAGAAGQSTLYIGFLFTSNAGYDCFMDAVDIHSTPACVPPTSVAASSITSTGATISWTASTSSPSSYDLYYSTSSTAPGSSTTPSATGITATSYNLTGLTANTTYYVYVRSACGGTSGNSAWTSAVSFVTPLANDECSGAIAITPAAGTSCTGVSGTNVNATTSTGFTQSCTATGVASDVWYSFTADGVVSYSITLTPTVSGRWTVSLFSGSCGSLSAVSCLEGAAGGGTVTLNAGVLPAGTYYYRVYARNEYQNTFTTCVSYIGAPSITSFTPESACIGAGTSVSITGNNFTGATAVAFNGVSATFTVVSNTSITATLPAGATTGAITVTTPVGNATSSTAFTVTAAPAVSVTPTSAVICTGGSATLTASGATTYSWSPTTGLSSTSGAVVTATPTVTTTYTVSGTSNGCSAAATTTITVSSAGTITAAANPSTVCSDQTTTLTGTYAGTAITGTIGTGTVKNTATTYPAPFGAYYWGAKHQMLIPASELTAAGLQAGNLTSVAFDVTTAKNLPLTGFTISIGSTSLSALTSTFATPTFTTVYSGDYTPSTSTGYANNTITFTTPFAWDGVSNIIVQTCFNNSSYNTNGNAIFNQTTTSYVSTSYYRADLATVCANTSATSTVSQRPNMRFTEEAVVPTYTTFNWSDGASSVATTNPATITVTNTSTAPVNKNYTLTATNAYGCAVTSNSTSVIVNPLTVISTQPVGSSYCKGQTPTNLSVAATGTGTLTYTWYKGNSATGPWTQVQSGTSNNYTPSTATEGTSYYYVDVSSASCGTATSNVVSVATTPLTVIGTQPNSNTQTLCEGDPISFSVTATGTGTLTYTWHKTKTTTKNPAVDAVVGTNSSTLNTTVESGTTYYYVVVSSSVCGDAISDISGAVQSIAVTITTITPSTQTVCQGTTAQQYDPLVSGTNPEYTWYKSTENSTNTANATVVANTRRYRPLTTAAEVGTYYYFLYVESGICNNASAYSNVLKVTVNAPSTAPTSVTASANAICAGQSTILTLNGGTLGTGADIHWYTGSCGGTSVGTGNDLQVNPTTTTTYYGRYEDPAPCNTATACRQITITVNPVPTAAISGTASVCQNSTPVPVVTFTGSNGTAPYTFTYKVNGGTNQTVTTASGNSVTVSQPTNNAGAFTYTLVSVKDNSSTQCSSSASGSAVITVNATPTASISAGSVTSSCATGIQLNLTGTPDAIVTYTINGGSPQTVQLVGGNAQLTTSSDANTYVYTITGVTLGDCSSVPATNNSISVTVYGKPTLTLTSGQPNPAQCGYGTITPITYTLGGSATTATITVIPAGAGITGVYNSTDKTVTISGTPTQATNYTYTITTNSNGDCSAAEANGTITISPYTWNGNVSTVWADANNWCGGVPASGADVTISPSATYSPVLPSGTTTVGNLVINTGKTVTINPGNTLQVSGTIGGGGTLTGSEASSLVTNGTTTVRFTQSGTGNYLRTLTVSGGTLTLGDALNIADAAGVVTVSGTGQLATGGNLTLKSSGLGTASVGEYTGTAHPADYITGDVQAERYTDAGTNGAGKRAWRLMASPVVNQTISQAWQEGLVYNSQNPVLQPATYGTLITGQKLQPGDAGTLGFDYIGAGNNASIKRYDAATNSWVPLANTNATPVRSIADPAYMLFVRGDRRANTKTAKGPDILHPKGTLLQGTQTYGISAFNSGTNRLFLMGNPYAAPLDFAAVMQNNGNKAAIENQFYAWDPKLGDLGAYVTVEDLTNTGTYSITPDPMATTGTTGVTQFIQSGQGFFVTPSTTGGTLTIDETMKNTAQSTALSASPFRVVAQNVRQLVVNLNLKDDTSAVLADGFRARFSDDYLGHEEEGSLLKAWNFSENLNLQRSGKALIIEARKDVQKEDTLFMRMWNVTKRGYQLQMKADNFASAPGVEAWLEDSYLKTKQPISLKGDVISFDFTVTSDSLSAKSDRFMIVFRNNAAVLPVTVTKVSAQPRNGGAEVSWTVTNEVNIRSYMIEKSVDGGQTYTAIGTQAAHNNAQAAITSYSGFDAAPKAGDNLYRIRIEGKDGSVSYSSVAKVVIGEGGSGIRIVLYPNPVRDGKATLQLTNLKEGAYLVSVYSGSGQTVYQRKIAISQPNTTQSETLLVGKGLAQGSYQLRVADHKGNIVFTDKLLVSR